MSLPFEQIKISDKSFIRKFSSNLEGEELYWHKDRCDRVVKIISGSGWMFQEENKVPVELFPGSEFLIKKETWHRIIRGSDDLNVFIEEKE